MDKSLSSLILEGDLEGFQKKTFKSELKNILHIYATDFVNAERLICLRYLSRYVKLKEFTDLYGRTLLHYAVLANVRSCDYLLKEGCDINAVDNDGNTPMHISVMYASKECSKFLIDNGADMSIRNNNGKTPRDIGT